MDFVDPPVDFTGMAKALGLEAIRITDPAELKPKLTDAFRRPGAKLIEVVLSNSVN
jgi:benzoylformate decarboxylase